MSNPNVETALFASGCFWGTEYHLKRQAGVLETSVGFTGGHIKNPAYREVCRGTTGHAEAVKVVFDPSVVSYETLTKLFFETHDPTQLNRQGPDVGTQYRTEIFVFTEEQAAVANKLIEVLTSSGLDVQTKVTPAGPFYSAEEYHHDYYNKTGGTPYCHVYTKRFE